MMEGNKKWVFGGIGVAIIVLVLILVWQQMDIRDINDQVNENADHINDLQEEILPEEKDMVEPVADVVKEEEKVLKPMVWDVFEHTEFAGGVTFSYPTVADGAVPTVSIGGNYGELSYRPSDDLFGGDVHTMKVVVFENLSADESPCDYTSRPMCDVETVVAERQMIKDKTNRTIAGYPAHFEPSYFSSAGTNVMSYIFYTPTLRVEISGAMESNQAFVDKYFDTSVDPWERIVFTAEEQLEIEKGSDVYDDFKAFQEAMETFVASIEIK